MPFYEYQCSSCGQHLEAMQRISDSPIKKCPQCGRLTMKRLMSAPVFRLKGAGWYETDFKSDQDNKRNLADKPEAEAPKEEKDVKKEPATADAKSADKPAVEAGKTTDKPADKPAEKPAEKPTDRSTANKPRAVSVSKSRTRAAVKKRPRVAGKRRR